MGRPTARRSPLLANSAFSGLDLWNHRVFKTNPTGVLDSPTLPTVHTLPDLSSVPVHTVNRPPSVADSDKSITSFGERESFETARDLVLETAEAPVSAHEFPALGLPVNTTPQSNRMERRRSWQKARGAVVNWAKPLWLAEEEGSAEMDESERVRIFGVSLQRTRRLHADNHGALDSSPIVPNTPASLTSDATSSDDESGTSTPPPETPMDLATPPSAALVDIPETPGLEEAFTDCSEEQPSQLKGLGFTGVTGLERLDAEEAPVIPPTQFVPFTLGFPSPPPRPAKAAARPMMHASPSLECLSSPSTLAELRDLRQAATDLERQVRTSTTPTATPRSGIFRARKRIPAPPLVPGPAPSTPLPPTPRVAPSPIIVAPATPMTPMTPMTPATPAGESSRKIKRKAVPVFLQPAEQISPLRTPEISSSSNSPRRSIDVPEVMPAPLPVPSAEPVATSSIRKPVPVQDVTPRQASLPFHIPPRSTSSHTRKCSSSDDSTSISSLSGSATSSDGPSTPDSASTRVFTARPVAVPKTNGGIYGNKNKGAFMSMLDLSSRKASVPAASPSAHKRTGSSGLYAAKGAFMSVLDLSAFKKDEEAAKTHKRSTSGGLYAAKGAFMSVLDLSAFKKDDVEIAKPKRSFSSRFFLGRGRK